MTTVTSKLIDRLIVEMMKGEKADASRYVETTTKILDFSLFFLDSKFRV